MKSRLEHDYTEVIEFGTEHLSGTEDDSVQGGAALSLCAGRDGSIAFAVHGREWLSNKWGDRKFVKLEVDNCYHYSVQDLAEFFERCAARLRQYKR